MVTVSFDPFSATEPAASFGVPLFVLIFILVILGVHHRRDRGLAAAGPAIGAPRAVLDADVSALRREIEILNDRLATQPQARRRGRCGDGIAYQPPAVERALGASDAPCASFPPTNRARS